MELNKIYNMDCMKGLQELEPCSVDCIITDPPYGIDFQSAWRTEKERFDKIANDGKPFIWWLGDAYRVVKEGGSILCFCRWDVQEAFKLALEWAGFEVKSQVIWDRGNHGLGDLNGQFAPMHDVAWFAVKGGFKFGNGRPKSILRYMRVSPENLKHPNEKPIELIRYLVHVLTKEGDVVLDCFVGCGPVPYACKQLGRSFIGFEIDLNYCKVAEERLKQEILTLG